MTRPFPRAVETRSRPLDHARFRVVARVAKNVSEARVFSPTRWEIVFVAGDAPWSRGPGRGRHRGHRRRSMNTCEEDISSAERPKSTSQGSWWTRYLRSPQLVFAIRLAKKRRSALQESARIDECAITHLVRELVGVTLVDGLGGEEESGTVLGSHLRRVRLSRKGDAGQSPDDAMAGSWKKLSVSRQTRKTRSRAPARRRRATARDASQFRVDARARRVSVRVVP